MGLSLWTLHDTVYGSLLLAIGFGLVMALFGTIPCRKLVQDISPPATLIQLAVEVRQPNRLILKD
jgi:hypothetical protein